MNAAPGRAMRRWAWRTVRRDRRQHLLVLALVTVAVAAAVFMATMAYNVTPDRSGDFGTATHRFETTVVQPEAIDRYLADARSWFGTIEAIGHRRLDVPGSTATVDLRTMAADGAFHGPMATLVEGRAPTTDDEVALTDGAAADLGATVGDDVDLGGVTRAVVGLVENTGDLDDEYAWVLPPSSAGDDIEDLTLLVAGDEAKALGFRPSVEPGPGFREARDGGDDRTLAAVLVVVVAVVAMVLVGLVTGASFFTLAHRRMRQLGVLAAVGASPRQQRQAVVGTGIAVGVLAGVVGTLGGLVAWLVTAPSLEAAAGHRIDRFAVPLWLLVAGPGLAVATATVSAWWPARAIARIPITDAIAARPPRPRRVRRSAVLAAVGLAVLGVVAISSAVDMDSEAASPVPLALGVVALVVAILLVSAPVLRGVARAAGRAPVGARLAVRDLARFEGRSAPALGAIALSLSIAVSVVVIVTAAAPDAAGGNLAADELIVWRSDPGRSDGVRVEAPDEADRAPQEQALARIEDLVPGSDTVTLELAVDAANSPSEHGRPLLATAILGRPIDEHTIRDSGLIYVATPELLGHLGIDDSTISPDTWLLTRQRGTVYITGDLRDPTYSQEPVPAGAVERIDVPDRSSAPRTLVTAAGMAATGLVPSDVGWLLTVDRPIPAATLGAMRDIAAGAGLAIETRDGDGGRATARNIATAAGMLLALAILAMTIGLLRSDAARDLRTLTATGAPRRVRRTIAASTSAVLAGVGATLAVATTYAALLAGYWPDTDRLTPVPVGDLVAIVVGLPVVAAVAGWLLGGAEPADLGRTE